MLCLQSCYIRKSETEFDFEATLRDFTLQVKWET